MKKISVKKALLILFIIALAGVSTIFVLAQKNKKSDIYETEQAKRGELIQTVSETGVVNTGDTYELSFERNGTVDKIYFEIGDSVKSGELLAELDKSDLDIKLSQAQASLEIAQANLAKLQSGVTAEEIAVYRANLDRAQASYDSSLVELEKYENSLKDNISQAEKNLNDLRDKTSFTVTTYEQAVSTAKDNLENTKETYQKSIDDSIDTSLTNSEAQLSSANNALDQINTIIDDEDLEEFLSVKNKNYLFNAENSYKQATELLNDSELSLEQARISPEKNQVKDILSQTLNTLNKTYLSLNNTFSALENSITSSAFTQAELDAFKTAINTQIGIISTSISTIQSSQQSLDSAILSYNTNVNAANNNLSQARANLENALTSAENNLVNVKNNGEQQLAALQSKVDAAAKSLSVSKAELQRVQSPARSEDLRLYRAQLRQAQAELNSVNNQIEKSKIKAPISGVISKINYEKGEQYSVGRNFLTLISGNRYEIEVDISESDIPKVKIGDPVDITLDALGYDIRFSGKVKFIEPAETVIQDVIYYRVEISFDSQNSHIDRVKPGMTANLDITTNKKDNVLSIPGRAIVEKDNHRYVRVVENGVMEEKIVETGIIGDGGIIEIISGIKEGDNIVTFVREN